METELDFLKNNVAYNSSFNLCYYKPKNMTSIQVEDGFIELLKTLSGFYQIIRRSLSSSFTLTIFLLYMNWEFRREYIALKRKKRLRKGTFQ